jgi:hypothetical protein
VAWSTSALVVWREVMSSQETMALTDEVITTRRIVGIVKAEERIPTVPLQLE